MQGFFTSGTTGVPKSVSHTHKCLGASNTATKFPWVGLRLGTCTITASAAWLFEREKRGRGVSVELAGTIKALNLQHDNDDCWGHFGPLFHCGTPAFIWISAAWRFLLVDVAMHPICLICRRAEVMLGARQVFHECPGSPTSVMHSRACHISPRSLGLLLAPFQWRGISFSSWMWRK